MKENNKLLAEFLGWENLDKTCLNVGEDTFIIDSGLVYDRSYLNLELEDGSSVCTVCAEYLKFNSDWNWLMQVVEKIENSETKDGRTFTIDMHRDSVLIFEYGLTTNEIVFTEGEGRFENLYNACVDFVEWLNKEECQKAVMNSIDLE